jgi:hypothetical protein
MQPTPRARVRAVMEDIPPRRPSPRFLRPAALHTGALFASEREWERAASYLCSDPRPAYARCSPQLRGGPSVSSSQRTMRASRSRPRLPSVPELHMAGTCARQMPGQRARPLLPLLQRPSLVANGNDVLLFPSLPVFCLLCPRRACAGDEGWLWTHKRSVCLHAWIPRPASACCCPVFTHDFTTSPPRAHLPSTSFPFVPVVRTFTGHERARWISRPIHACTSARRCEGGRRVGRSGCACAQRGVISASYPRSDTPSRVHDARASGAAGRRAPRLLSALHSVPEMRMRGRRGVAVERTRGVLNARLISGPSHPIGAEDMRVFTSFLVPQRIVTAGPNTREAVGGECRERPRSGCAALARVALYPRWRAIPRWDKGCNGRRISDAHKIGIG